MYIIIFSLEKHLILIQIYLYLMPIDLLQCFRKKKQHTPSEIAIHPKNSFVRKLTIVSEPNTILKKIKTKMTSK